MLRRNILRLSIIFVFGIFPGTGLYGSPEGHAQKTDSQDAPIPVAEGELISSEQDAEIKALEERLANLDTSLEEYRSLEVAANEGTASLGSEAVQKRIAALRKMQAALQQHLRSLRMYKDIVAQSAKAQENIRDFQRIEEPPPYTVAFLDRLCNTLNTKRLDVEAEKVSMRTALERVELERPDIATAKATLNREEERLRTASEAEREAVGFDVETAQRMLEANEAELHAAEMEAKRFDAYVQMLELDIKLTTRKTELVRNQTVFSQKELDEIKERQQSVIDGLVKEIQEAQEQIAKLKEKLPVVEQSVSAAPDLEAQGQAKKDLQLIHMRMEEAETRLSILEALQNIENGVIRLWELRFQIANPSLAQEERDWSLVTTTLRDRLDLLYKEKDAGEQRAISLRGQITALENNLREGATSEKGFLEEQLNILSERILIRNRIQQRMSQAVELAERFLEEAEIHQNKRSLLESFSEYIYKALGVVGLGFDREITIIGGESITGRKIFYMLLIFVCGIMLSRLLTRYIRNYALRKLKLRSNVVLIIAKLTNYITFIIVVYLALNYVNIPLTIFTFMGGAIALGVGFGAQNLINNFLSGLILMGEQPIRLGDIVEIDGKVGTVTNIGARASSLRMFNGYDVLIPNSKFLETSVINWTLSDHKVRLQVEVGVAYGSNTREVARLMLHAVTEHGQILTDPEPKVMFESFGDSALQFCVYFWVELGPSLDGRVVTSDVRHRIDRLLQEGGIVFAYPQRDVHLDTITPMEVRIVKDNSDNQSTQDPGA